MKEPTEENLLWEHLATLSPERLDEVLEMIADELLRVRSLSARPQVNGVDAEILAEPNDELSLGVGIG